jgi:hypothetical protein
MSQFVRDPGNITAIQSDFASGASDPVALVEEMLQRAEEIKPHVQAWLSLDADEALRQARACRDEMQHGILRGPLHGIPVAVKDVIDTAGQQTRAGSRSRAQCSPARINADVASMLRAAGAVILGKVHTTEYAYFGGPPPNSQSLACRAYTGRIERRVGCCGRIRHGGVQHWHANGRLDRASRSLLPNCRIQTHDPGSLDVRNGSA